MLVEEIWYPFPHILVQKKTRAPTLEPIDHGGSSTPLSVWHNSGVLSVRKWTLLWMIWHVCFLSSTCCWKCATFFDALEQAICMKCWKLQNAKSKPEREVIEVLGLHVVLPLNTHWCGSRPSHNTANVQLYISIWKQKFVALVLKVHEYHYHSLPLFIRGFQVANLVPHKGGRTFLVDTLQ